MHLIHAHHAGVHLSSSVPGSFFKIQNFQNIGRKVPQIRLFSQKFRFFSQFLLSFSIFLFFTNSFSTKECEDSKVQKKSEK